MRLSIFRKRASSPRSAEEWYILNQRTDLSEEECLEFLAWLQADSENERNYEKVEKTSQLMREAAVDFDLSDKAPGADDNRYQFRSWAPAMAASIAFLALTAAVYFIAVKDENKFQTNVGEQRVVALDDGSVVRLNTSTEIEIDYGESQRRISLNSGEAFFDVQRDAQGRPFMVEIDGLIVRAIGTEFNIRHSTEGTSVDVLEGVVEVLKAAPQAESSLRLSEISEGFKVFIEPDGGVSDITSADVLKINAWTDGRLEFDADRLAAVVAEFNRYSKTKMIIADEALGELPISGSFVIGRSEEFARGLEGVFPITVIKRRNALLLTSAASPQKAEPPG